MKRPARAAAWIVAGAAVLLAPFVISDRYLLKVLTLAGVNTLIVIGLAVLFGYAGQISLGHAAFFGIGAYASAYLTGVRSLPWLLAVLVGVVLASLAGWAVAVPGLRLKGHYLAMATLGFNEILGVVFVEARTITGGNDGLGGIPFPSIGPFELTSPVSLYLLVWSVAIIAYVAAANIVRSRPGRAMRALHGTEPGALACGVDIASVKIRAFTLSAGLAGLAGALYAHSVGFISPTTFGLDLSILLVAAVVLGRRESLVGPILAMAVLTLLNYPAALVPGLPRDLAEAVQDWVPDVVGLTVVGALLVRSRGIRLRARDAAEAGSGER